MRQPFTLATLLFAGILAATACGQSSSDSAAETTQATQPAATAAPASAPNEAELVELAVADRPTFVGKLEGSDAYVAFVEEADGLLAYVCEDGELGLWFRGEAGSSALEATHPTGAVISAQRSSDGFAGSVTIEGAAHEFTTAAATHPAGLWEAIDLADEEGATANGRFGWIVLPDGSQQGALVSKTGTRSAGTLDTSTGTSGSTTAAPSTQDPQPTALTDEGCQGMYRVFKYSISQLNATNDTWYDRAARLAVSAYDNGGCQARFGSIVD